MYWSIKHYLSNFVILLKLLLFHNNVAMSSSHNMETNTQIEDSTSSYLSTNGTRGHKRPRNSRKHFATCKNLSSTAPIIHCECPVFDPGHALSTGMKRETVNWF